MMVVMRPRPVANAKKGKDLCDDELLGLSRLALDVSSDLCMWADREGHIIYANETACRALGYTKNELLSMKVMDFDACYDEKRYSQFWDEVKRSGSLKLESVHVRKDGSRFPVRMTINFVKLGEKEYAFNFIRDITERKRAEDELINSRQMLQLVLDNIPQAVFWKDRNSVYLGCNKVLARDSGLKYPGDIIGRTDYDFPLTREQAESFRKYDQLVMSRDEPIYHIIEDQRRPDGTMAWLDTNKIPLHDPSGNVIGILCTYGDITERKLAEEALLRSEMRLKKSQEIAHLGSWELDFATNHLSWSDEVYRIFGLEPQEFGATYEAFLEVVHPDDRAAVDAAYSSSVREGLDTYEMEHRIVRKATGEVRYVHEKCEHFRDESGRVVRSVGMVHDITDSKLSEKALEEAKAQVELYLDLMGHDINNMHQIALGYLELARGMPPGVQHDEMMDKPIEVLQRSTQLISNVRKLQKLHDGVFQSDLVDVCKVLVAVRREYGTMPGKTVTLNMNGYAHCQVRANDLLHDVFSNLVGNAIKHTREGAEIVVDLDVVTVDGHHYCRVMVEDDGPGIPDDFKGKIFNRLLKGTEKAKGMGLGLYLVKSLVDSYGGRVWAEDRVLGNHTKGARFVVMLPAVEK
jgi:PAS domain S-box-containing protein